MNLNDSLHSFESSQFSFCASMAAGFQHRNVSSVDAPFKFHYVIRLIDELLIVSAHCWSRCWALACCLPSA